MALPHLASNQIISLQPLGAQLQQVESHALLKTAQLEVLRIVLPAGKTLPEHAVPGDITLQCLEGRAQLRAGGTQQPLQAHDFVYLVGQVAHEITALTDCCLLVTIRL